jgi:RimJ/RimL family protein N-acetyltransferase
VGSGEKSVIDFEDVYLHTGEVSDETVSFLFGLLSERDDITNISHIEMPTFNQHHWFLLTRPYLEWNLIVAAGERIGSIYVSRDHEIGIFILKAHRGKGYGKKAVDKVKERYKGCVLLANINPKNSPSIKMFEEEGFEHIQNTYRLKN